MVLSKFNIRPQRRLRSACKTCWWRIEPNCGDYPHLAGAAYAVKNYSYNRYLIYTQLKSLNKKRHLLITGAVSQTINLKLFLRFRRISIGHELFKMFTVFGVA